MSYNSDFFNLTNWKLTLPVDSNGGTSGTATEIKNLTGFEDAYFYDAPDEAMVFRASADGATTSGSTYPRCELREMNSGSLAGWSTSTGGTMTATLEVNTVPTKFDGTPGRIIVGQIHGQSDELCRLYYENGTVYFMDEHSTSDNKEHKFTFTNASGQQPNISLGEKFSYKIDAHGNTLNVDIFADGQIYHASTTINSYWQTDKLYFKAGVYLGVNDGSGSGTGKVSFYGLDFGHTAGSGLGGWETGMVPTSSTTTSIKVQPYTGNHTYDAGSGNIDFIFYKHTGNTTISHFSTGDILDIESKIYSSASQALSHVTYHGSDAVLALDKGCSITLLGVGDHALHTTDFHIFS